MASGLQPALEAEGGRLGGEARQEVLDAGGALPEVGPPGLFPFDDVLRGALAEGGVGQACFKLGQRSLGLLPLLLQPLALRGHVDDATQRDGERGFADHDAEGAVQGQFAFVVQNL